MATTTSRRQHLTSEAPTSTVEIYQERRRRLVLIGDITDADLTRVVTRVAPTASGLYIADVIRLGPAADRSAQDAALTRLAAQVPTPAAYSRASAPGPVGPPLLVTRLKLPADSVARKRVDAVLAALRGRGGRRSVYGDIRVVPIGRLAADAKSVASDPTDLSEAQAFLQDNEEAIQERFWQLMAAKPVRRDPRAAAEAVSRLLSRGASQNVIGEHLRAYGYLNERDQLGVWPQSRVRDFIAQVQR